MRRKYSDRERAEALALHDAGLSLTEISGQTGIPDSTLSQWFKENKTSDLREFSKKSLADKFEACAHLYLARAVEGEAIQKTSGYYAVKAANKGAVTANLLRGQPTQITADKSLQESSAKLIALAKEIGVELDPDRAKEIMAAKFAEAEVVSDLVS